jgi:hypothetical protein
MPMPSDSTLSLIGQILVLVVGLMGALRARSRYTIWGWAMLGGFGAMVAHMMYDGQGAFLYIFVIPVIYWVAVAGRSDLDPPSL